MMNMFELFAQAACDPTKKLINTCSLPDVLADGKTLETILSVVFVTLGAVAVLIITLAGLMYVVSHGDAKVIAQAKNAILYAVIGLVVAVSGFSIVNFFIGSL